MKTRLLEAFGIDAEVVRIWEARYGTDLLPVQEKAIRQTSLLKGGNLIVFAPTTSGKTLIGEMLAVSSIRKGKRVFYLVPTKALAEEKFNELQEAYRPLGIVPAISTRDHREWDDVILTKGFDIAVVVYEKFQSLLVARPSLLEEIGVVILDELQMLSDEERGPTIELLLTKLLRAKERPQLLGLSAVLGEGEALARWLRADLLVEEKRPVELRKGIFCRGAFSYREHNSGAEGEETWKVIRGEAEIDIMIPLAAFLAEEKGESSLLFLKDKPTVEKVARKISEAIRLPAADEAIEELLTLEETTSRDFLIRLLKKGVGIHHADLPLAQRQLMARQFQAGAIRILAATSTLAMGINCPAKNVLIESRQWHTFRRHRGTDTRPLPRSLHENMAGRGGRFGFIDDFGRAILVTDSPFKKKVWMDRYIRGRLEPLQPALKMEEVEEILINLIASGEAATADALADFLRLTYTAQCHWKNELKEIRLRVGTTLEKFKTLGAVYLDGEGRMAASRWGEITALKGIRLATATGLMDWMKMTDARKTSDLEILCALALTEDAKRIYLSLPYREQRARNYPNLLRKEMAHQQEEGKQVFRFLLSAVPQSEAEEARAIKKALLLLEWITTKGTAEIEQSYGIHAGAICRIAEEFSWLAETAAALAQAIGLPDEAVRKLSDLSDQLIDGVPVDGLKLSRMRLPGCSRSDIARLVREGYDTPEALSSLPIGILKKHLPDRLAEALYRHLHPEIDRTREKDPIVYPAKTAVSEASQAYAEPLQTSPILSIDVNQQLIIYNGMTIALSSRPFKLLLALARTPGRVVNKATLYDALYGTADDASEDDRPYERQLADHKRKILAQIRKGVGNQAQGRAMATHLENLISVRRGVGYTLNLAPTEVSIIKEPALIK